MEVVDSCMLEEPANYTAYGDIFTEPGNSRPQAADPPDLEFNLYTGLGSTVQRCDTVRIYQCVHLENEMPVPVSGVLNDLPFNAIDDAVTQGHGRNQKFLVFFNSGVSREEIE